MPKKMIEWENQLYTTTELLRKLAVHDSSFYYKMKKGYSREESIRLCMDYKKKSKLRSALQKRTSKNPMRENESIVLEYLVHDFPIKELVKPIFSDQKTKEQKKQSLKKFPYPDSSHMMNLHQIAKLEKIDFSNLYERVITEGQNLTLAISQIKTNQVVKKFAERIAKQHAKKISYRDISLYQYCQENHYDYHVIVEKVIRNHCSVDIAIKQYLYENQIDTSKKRMLLAEETMNQLFLQYNINRFDIDTVMEQFQWSLQETITFLCFRDLKEISNQQDRFYLYELYRLLFICNQQETEHIINLFCVSELQKQYLQKQHGRISLIQRELLYCILRNCAEQEKEKIVHLYGITKEELNYINSRIYHGNNLDDLSKECSVKMKKIF